MFFANAQSFGTESGIKPDKQAKANPFDFVMEVFEQEKNTNKSLSRNIIFQSSKQLQGKTGRSFARQYTQPKSPQLQYKNNLSLSKKQADNILRKLQLQYGKPTSIRGDSYVWDIKNPQASKEQADIVTIIFRKNKTGDYQLIMDRARGGDGKATWALPRRKKPAGSRLLQKKQNKQKAQQRKEPQL